MSKYNYKIPIFLASFSLTRPDFNFLPLFLFPFLKVNLIFLSHYSVCFENISEYFLLDTNFKAFRENGRISVCSSSGMSYDC